MAESLLPWNVGGLLPGTGRILLSRLMIQDSHSRVLFDIRRLMLGSPIAFIRLDMTVKNFIGHYAAGVAAFGAVIAITTTTGYTTSSKQAVRLHWDWATDAPKYAAAGGKQGKRQRVGMVRDFNSRQVIFPEVVPAHVVERVRNEPRFWQQYLHRHAHLYAQDPDFVPDHNRPGSVVRDWNYSLNNGSGGTIGTPAKYVFDVNATPSCTNDFVVTGVNIAGSGTQANLIAFNNLYNNPTGTGLCPGTAPTVLFSYNIGPGTLNSYVALSLDGTKVAFNEVNGAASRFHILTWKSGAGNGTSASAPAVPGTGNTAVDVTFTLTGVLATAPFIDYGSDVAYVTTNNGQVHKYSGVFTGTPAEVVTGGWPLTTPSGSGISTPVFDGVSRHLFFTDNGNGGIDYVDDSVVPATMHAGLFNFSPGLNLAIPLIVDSGNQRVYAFSPNNTTLAKAIVSQADTNLSAGSQVTIAVGTASAAGRVPLMGDFNENYYNGQLASSRFYVAGNDSSANRVPALYAIDFSAGFKMNAIVNGPLALATNTAGVNASPVTTFFNTTLNTQFLFVSVTNACSATIPGGCIRSLNVSNQTFPNAGNLNNVVFAAAGGTGGISIDNVSTAAGAASVYYTTLTGRTIVKATQAALQ